MLCNAAAATWGCRAWLCIFQVPKTCAGISHWACPSSWREWSLGWLGLLDDHGRWMQSYIQLYLGKYEMYEGREKNSKDCQKLSHQTRFAAGLTTRFDGGSYHRWTDFKPWISDWWGGSGVYVGLAFPCFAKDAVAANDNQQLVWAVFLWPIQ